jgi:formyltetrahydrofolate deformylase
MVSRHGHCLNDLLFRVRSGQLDVEVAAIVSNHPDFAELAASYRIPFHHFPLAPGAGAQDKRAQEQRIEVLIDEEHRPVVLARYMQILSPEFCTFLKGRAINIHHSFLPTSRAPSRTTKAHDRGVKLIARPRNT